MKKVSIGYKLAANNLLYVLPIIGLTVVLFKAKTNDIAFAQKEALGDVYQAPLENFMEQVARHKLLVP